MKNLKIQLFLSIIFTSNNESKTKKWASGTLEKRESDITKFLIRERTPYGLCDITSYSSHLPEVQFFVSNSLFNVEFADKKNCIFIFSYF